MTRFLSPMYAFGGRRAPRMAEMIRGIGEQTWAAADVLRGVAATGRRVGAATLGLLTGRYGAGVGQLARRGMLDQTWYTAVEALPVVIGLGLVVAAAAVGLAYPVLRAVGIAHLFGSLTQALVMDEAAPLLVAVLVIARSGTAIATELAAMRAANEIDALNAHGVNPHLYLGLPRVVGVLVATVCLTVVFCAAAYGGCLLVGLVVGLPNGELLRLLDGGLGRREILRGLLKAVLFGVTIPLVAVQTGLAGARDTAAAPRAASAVVVRALLPVLLLDGTITLAWYA